MADLVTFGEAMVRLVPPDLQRLEQTGSFSVSVGGAEANVAVNAARLGLDSSWVSVLPDQPIGRLIENRIRQWGVDTSRIRWTKQGRAGLYFAEFGAAPRPTSVLYDRSASAVSLVKPGDIDWKAAFKGAKLFHTSGITPALSGSAAEVTAEALAAAKKAGLTVSYDLNFRSKLWTHGKAGSVQAPLMKFVDVLETTEEDARKVFGIEGKDDAEVALRLAEKFGLKTVAVTLRVNHSVWRNDWSALAAHEGKILKTAVRTVEIVDRFGGGDSFTAAFLAKLREGDVQKALDFAAAASALKHSIPGDFNLVTHSEVEAVLKGGGLRVSR